ncbi:MAG: hypothetical protein FJW39_01530 [Acidobacteria bacterium]|nr:hypothetical protein [Acidobacteriota bacterium]
MKNFFAILALAAWTLSAQPVVMNVVPETAASGFGQLITIQGSGLAPSNNPKLTMVNDATGQASTCPFTLNPAGTDHEMYVRLASGGCILAAGKYYGYVEGANGTSEKFEFNVAAKPQRPIARSLCVNMFNGCQANASAWHGGTITVFGYGVDATNAIVEFRKGNMVIQVASTLVHISAQGVGIGAIVPSALGVGPVMVGLRSKVGTAQSTLSNLMKVQVEMP